MTSKPRAILAIALALMTTTGAIFGFIPEIWLCDLCSQFRLPFLVALMLSLTVCMALRTRIGILICLVGIVADGIPIAAMYLPGQKIVTDKTALLSILNFNTEFQHNDHFDALQQQLAAKNPDLFVLVEVNQKWIDAIAPITKQYPYQKIVLAGAGIALFSKYPLENIDVRSFGKSHHPRIFATVKINGQPVHLMVVHPTTPQSDAGFHERNSELALIEKELSATAAPRIIIGDFNCGPWAQPFQNLMQAGLRDSEQGFGPQPSWPARVGRVIDHVPVPPFVPIDHILVSDDIKVLERTAGPALQSDHLPVFVRLSVGPK